MVENLLLFIIGLKKFLYPASGIIDMLIYVFMGVEALQMSGP